MDDFTQMHIFFAVTTVAVVVLALLGAMLLIALIRVLRTIDRIANEVEEEAAEIRADLDGLRKDMKKGLRLVPWFGFFGKLARRTSSRKRLKN